MPRMTPRGPKPGHALVRWGGPSATGPETSTHQPPDSSGGWYPSPMTARKSGAKAADTKPTGDEIVDDQTTDDADPSDEDTREWVSTLTRDELVDMHATYTALLGAVAAELAVRPVDAGAEWTR